jgi:hypothetical protein
MLLRKCALIVLFASVTVPAFAQQPCLHRGDETAEQAARRKQALRATRTVNNIEANQPGSSSRFYLKHEELGTAPFVQREPAALKDMDFAPGKDKEIIPGWQLTLDVTTDGYWFMIKDKTDPCGFAYISNTNGLIYSAEHLR